MNLIIVITGIFCGIAVCMGTLYSVAQVILLKGAGRWIHFVAVVVMMCVMWFLLERDVPSARLISPLLLAICLATFWIEPRWYKILPFLQGVFAVMLFAGYVRF